ncbi:hypothetical protein K9U39_02245 [Rhodoblastus acidophilus]|uniref:Porin n=1 Tax=Candidatus Rhodoblastus alkanivorans TaxID=2954117 RepID=A0ABS9Z4E5_9HYPH|nr:hypothetical protein [Candidatus Rhodoblastus alkanivorans]MCI4679209.1 hypothetical protein [Candidatus Rhodoblastus alkanivorans]MCI4682467.1 hypothetical protein [Candidatus Rhodoblastus alkanivorans]MDI4639773.1 hypothetical protein [Rhodoblastus acidophilus]
MKMILTSALTSGLIFALGAGAAVAAPQALRSVDYEREMRAGAEQSVLVPDCVRANGAQILTGFAAPGDYLSRTTGEFCER